MTTQVSFTTDEDLKNKAMQKAKQEGLPLKTLFIYAMKGFVDGTISLKIGEKETEPEIEEVYFDDKEIIKKAEKLAALLK